VSLEVVLCDPPFCVLEGFLFLAGGVQALAFDHIVGDVEVAGDEGIGGREASLGSVSYDCLILRYLLGEQASESEEKEQRGNAEEE
jgi:hypothetical protein